MNFHRVLSLQLVLLGAGPFYNTYAAQSTLDRVSEESTRDACDPSTYGGPSVAAILDWATTAGITTHHFANDSEQAIRGLVAKHDIPPKTTLVRMKRSMGLNIIVGQNSPFPDLVPHHVWKSCGENRQLGLVLLKEAKQASKSKFKVYVDSLPREVPTLIHWSDSELQQLQMDSTPTEREFVAQVKQELSDTESDYDRLQNTPFVTSLDVTLDDLIWAADMSNSRSFAIPKDLAWFSPVFLGAVAVAASLFFKAPFVNTWRYAKEVSGGCRFAFMLSMGVAFLQSRASSEGDLEFALLPLMDLLNHNSSTAGELHASIFSSTVEIVSGAYTFQAGQEVTQSYGVKTNEALLQFYGFVDTDNVNDAYTTDMTDWVKAHYGVLEERWQFLATDGIAMQSLQQAELRHQGWSSSVLEALRFLLAPQREVDERQQLDPLQWAQQVYKYRELPHIMTAWKEECSPETEQRVYQVVHGFCSDILASKPTSLETDQQLLERLPGGTDSTNRQRLALQFRIAKKALLKACIWQYDPAQLAT
ncbi:hypothetical protein ABBQ38_006018 [Trebouxia sp. C0009 RCD-2024]